MPDKVIPFYPVVMLCKEPEDIPVPLPEGYTFEFFTPGMEEAWCQIQSSVRAFNNTELAKKQFEQEFSPHPRLLSRRMLFVFDSRHRAIATGVLWRECGMERLHWIAVVPGMHGNGIGKAIVSRLINIYRIEGCRNGIYLTAQSQSYAAINICRKFGFVPDIGIQFVGNPGSEEEFREAWRIIDGKISNYERCHGRDDSVDKLFPPSIWLNRKDGFKRPVSVRFFPYPHLNSPEIFRIIMITHRFGMLSEEAVSMRWRGSVMR